MLFYRHLISPRAPGHRGGGTGLLISPAEILSFPPLSPPHLNVVTVTCPLKLYIDAIYRSAAGSFLDELDTLIS
jgi:hypothetical protein